MIVIIQCAATKHAGAGLMHREISHADGAFQQESRLGLYLLTGLLGLLIGADVWPIAAKWSTTFSGWRMRMPDAVSWRRAISMPSTA